MWNEMLEFLRGFVRPYVGILIISAIVGLAVYLGIKFADAEMAKTVIIALLAAGSAIIGVYYGMRAASK